MIQMFSIFKCIHDEKRKIILSLAREKNGRAFKIANELEQMKMNGMKTFNENSFNDVNHSQWRDGISGANEL